MYRYNGAGQLLEVTDAVGNKTTMTYDLLGRKLTMNDPDMGAWTYTYDAAGSLKTQTDARLITTTLIYDVAQRLTSKTYSNSEAPVSFLYDAYPDTTLCPQAAITATGMMVRMTDGAGQQHACFDARGRSVKTRRSVDGVNYDMSYVYDPLGQVKQTTYPDGDVVAYSQTAQGNVTGLSSDVDGIGTAFAAQTLLSNAVPTALGSISSLPLGNGHTTNYTYDFRNRLTNITTGTAQNVALTYDDASNITAVADSTAPETVTYTYDQLNRLVGAGNAITAAYQYNAIGNLLTKQEGASNLTLSYPASGAGSVRPHAVSSTTGSLVRGFTYDENGNLAGGGDHAYDFDAENRVPAILRSVPATRQTPGWPAWISSARPPTKLSAWLTLSRSTRSSAQRGCPQTGTSGWTWT